MLFGVDVSTWQPRTDWAQAATAIDFGIVKVTENSDYTNPLYRAQTSGVRGANLELGHYHFARPGLAPLLEQVGYFLRQLVRRDGEPVALDLEEGEGDLSNWAYDFMAAVEDTLRTTPLFYSYPSFLDEHNLHDPRLARFRSWYAWYPNGGKPDTAWPSVAPWGTATIWQYTADGRVPGIDTVVDLNVFDGTRAQFRGLDGPARREPDPNRLRAWFASRRVA
jgi:lysozyme